METLYLLLSITSTFLTSSLLSLLLLIRTIFKRLRDASTACAVKTSLHSVYLYEGTVWHERRHPVRHSFQYSVRYALFDLDHAPHPPPDHLSADDARRVTCTDGPVLLLTIPSSVGYEQNPLSLYYCYDLDGTEQHLSKCIAEVTNTPWGERVRFVFNPNSDLVAKPLHVSPFMHVCMCSFCDYCLGDSPITAHTALGDLIRAKIWQRTLLLYAYSFLHLLMDMQGNWSISTAVPGDNLSVFISVQHPELGDCFVATLKAKRISSVLVSDLDMFFWLMPHKVALWIYWHALKLWWKNVPFIQHPRYNNPAYREEASMRDRKLQCCKAVEGDSNGSLRPEEGHPGNLAVRSFEWRDAKWPWC